MNDKKVRFADHEARVTRDAKRGTAVVTMNDVTVDVETGEGPFGPRRLCRIDGANFYEDERWLRWLNDPKNGPATWHKRGEEPTEFSDVFIHYGGVRGTNDDGSLRGEGSDFPDHPSRPGIPDDLYALIAACVQEAFGDSDVECLVWVSNT